VTGRMRGLIRDLNESDLSRADLQAKLAVWRELHEQLLGDEKHYARKGNALSPYLEEHGVTGPSQVMWGKDDDIRVMLESLREAFTARDASFFERSDALSLGQLRLIPDLVILLLCVLPLAHFLFRTYPLLKARQIQAGESVWERLGVELQGGRDSLSMQFDAGSWREASRCGQALSSPCGLEGPAVRVARSSAKRGGRSGRRPASRTAVSTRVRAVTVLPAPAVR
jgi:hypothetical protein